MPAPQGYGCLLTGREGLIHADNSDRREVPSGTQPCAAICNGSPVGRAIGVAGRTTRPVHRARRAGAADHSDTTIPWVAAPDGAGLLERLDEGGSR